MRVSNWQELNGLISKDGKYIIDVDMELFGAHVRDIESNRSTAYISTHLFYKKSGRTSKTSVNIS